MASSTLPACRNTCSSAVQLQSCHLASWPGFGRRNGSALPQPGLQTPPVTAPRGKDHNSPHSQLRMAGKSELPACQGSHTGSDVAQRVSDVSPLLLEASRQSKGGQCPSFHWDPLVLVGAFSHGQRQAARQETRLNVSSRSLVGASPLAPSLSTGQRAQGRDRRRERSACQGAVLTQTPGRTCTQGHTAP